jgi:hypothetical protein
MPRSVVAFVDRTDDSMVRNATAALAPFERVIVDFYSRDPQDLMLVAKYRIVHTPTVLVLEDANVVARFMSVPEFDVMKAILGDTSVPNAAGR